MAHRRRSIRKIHFTPRPGRAARKRRRGKKNPGLDLKTILLIGGGAAIAFYLYRVLTAPKVPLLTGVAPAPSSPWNDFFQSLIKSGVDTATKKPTAADRLNASLQASTSKSSTLTIPTNVQPVNLNDPNSFKNLPGLSGVGGIFGSLGGYGSLR